MTSPSRLYFDNAATTYPKPEEVYAAVESYQRNCGAAVGRGAYRASVDASGIVQRCRKRIAELLHAEGPDRIVFTFNATDGLNMALWGLLRSGDHVVTSAVEHNSIVRPLRALQDRLGVETTIVAASGAGFVDPDDFRRALRPNTKLVALVHASNVTGALQPVDEVGRIARAAGVLFLVDAAQTAGHWPIELSTLPADLLVSAGHKGLLGPLGTGVLYLRPGVESQLTSYRQGGTGTQSEDDHQPESLPEKFESGNHNGSGLAGLEAGAAWLQKRGIDSLAEHAAGLTKRLIAGLQRIPGVRVYGPVPEEPRLGVVSFTLEGFEPHDAALVLDESFGIEVRAGLHCAPGAHRALGTLETGGTIRASVGPFHTETDVERLCEALREMTGAL